jgi:hypothetical protein
LEQVFARIVAVVFVMLSLNLAVAQSCVIVSGHTTLYQNDSVFLPDGTVNFCAMFELW